MSWKRRLSAALFTLVAIGLTPVQRSWALDRPTSPLRNPLCASLLTPSQIHFETKSDIKSPEDAIAYWERIANDAASRPISWRFLSNVDYARPLLLIRDQFSSAQVERLFEIFSSLGAYQNGEWNKILLPMKVLFKPELAQDYYGFEADTHEYIQLLVGGSNLAKDFNYATVTALNSLPGKQRRAMQNFFFKKINEYRASPPSKVFTRRNAEVLYRALFETEFQEFLSDLVHHTTSGEIDTRFATKRIEQLWHLMWPGSNNRFSDVLSVARIIQKGPLDSFLGVEAIDLFGSFPNGKATFPRSDIDVHLSINLEMAYRNIFGRKGSYAEPETGVIGENQALLQKSFFELEKAIAGHLVAENLSRYTPGHLLSVSTEGGYTLTEWFSPKFYGQQTPIMLKVTKEKTILQVYDAYRSHQLYEAELR